MPEITNTKIVAADRHAMDFPVTLSGATITVGAGTMKYNGVDWPLLDDEVFTVVNRPDETEIVAYIVIDRGTVPAGELRVFVDDVIQDGIDVRHKFERSERYELVAYLYRVTIPGGTTDVSTLDYHRWRIIARPPEE